MYILFLVSLLFVALLDPFDPYSPFKFFINLVCLLFIGHKDYNNHTGAHTYRRYTNYTGAYVIMDF